MNNELLPCPFCGSPAMWKEGSPNNSPVGYVKCANENCGFYICSKPDVWKNPSCWNTRAPSEREQRYKTALGLFVKTYENCKSWESVNLDEFYKIAQQAIEHKE